MSSLKTKRVGGTDLSSKYFLFAPDPANTDGWLLPVHDPTSNAKTINLVKTHLARFAEMKAIPPTERAKLWERLVGAAIANGIPVGREDVVPAEPVRPTPKPVERVDPMEEAVFADADRKATAFLKSLGYE
jgi:hypothetical protein